MNEAYRKIEADPKLKDKVKLIGIGVGNSDIPIEQRDESEVLGAWGAVRNPKAHRRSPRLIRRAFVRVANPSSGALNPGFDVTPPELIMGIITPIGIFPPRELWARRRALGGPA